MASHQLQFNVGPNDGTHSPLHIAVRVSLLALRPHYNTTPVRLVPFPEANVASGISRHKLLIMSYCQPSTLALDWTSPAWDGDPTTAFRRLTSSVLTPRIRDPVWSFEPAKHLINPYCSAAVHYKINLIRGTLLRKLSFCLMWLEG
jgi:hypothetical protein